eukprot:104383-Chlamydomonas_euryale.AAC.1
MDPFLALFNSSQPTNELALQVVLERRVDAHDAVVVDVEVQVSERLDSGARLGAGRAHHALHAAAEDCVERA